MKPGDRFADRFTVMRRLGGGNFGTVYHAFDETYHRDVALKIPGSGVLLDDHFMKRFRAEANILSRLKHPCIVTFYDAHLDARPRFLVTEYVKGHDLEHELAVGRKTGRSIDRGRALKIVVDLAGALHHAHLMRVVHRDVKPANVLVQGDLVKLTDFGLARFGDPRMTQAGSRVGTPFYMSPEQVEGEPDRITPKADQYALGVLLYELLCGRVPFEGPTAESVYPKILHNPPPNLRILDDTIPPGLVDACLRALAKDPADRWPDCAAFANALRPWAPGALVVPTPSHPSGSAEASGESASRIEPLKKVGGAIAGRVKRGLAEGGSRLEPLAEPLRPLGESLKTTVELSSATIKSRWPVWVGWFVDILKDVVDLFNERLRQFDPPAPEPPPGSGEASASGSGSGLRPGSVLSALSGETRPGRSAAGGPRRSAEEADDFRTLEQAHRAWREHRRADARALLDRCPAGRRGWEWAYLAALCRSRVTTLAGHAGEVTALAFDPDGRSLAAGEEGGVRVWDPTTARVARCLEGHFRRGEAAAFSPDGRWLAVAGGKAIRVWDLHRADRDEPDRAWQAHDALVTRLAFAADGVHLISAGIDRAVRVWDFHAESELPPLLGPESGVHALAVHPSDPARVYAGYGDGTVIAWDWAGRRECARNQPRTGAAVDALAVHPGGRLVATGDRDGMLAFWDTDSLSLVAAARAHAGATASLAFHPDGRWLASIGAGGLRSVRIGVGSPDAPASELGRAAVAVPIGSAALASLAFDPATPGRLALAGTDRTVKLWDPRGLWDALADGRPTGLVRAVAVHPGGRHRAVARLDGAVEFQALAAGAAPRVLPGVAGPVNALAFLPGGMGLAAAGDDGNVTAWDLASGQLTATLPAHPRPVLALAFDPAGDFLATACADGHVRLWDARTFDHEPLLDLAAHDGKGATAVAFIPTPDGLRLYTAGADRLIHAWDPEGGDMLATFEGHARRVAALAPSVDGRRLVSVGDDRTLRVWDTARAAPVFVLHNIDVLGGLAWQPAAGVLAAVGEDRALIVEKVRSLGSSIG